MRSWFSFPSVDARRTLRAAGRFAGRTFRATGRIVRRVFAPVREGQRTLPANDARSHVHRFRLLARLCRREMMLATDLGVLSKILLREGHPEEARRIAWTAYTHWRTARRALKRLGSA